MKSVPNDRNPAAQQRTGNPTVQYRSGARLAGPSIESQVLYQACRWFLRPVVRMAPLNESAIRRAALLDMAAGFRPASGIRRQKVRLPGFDAEIVRAPGVSPDLGDGVVLYLHGGGFLCCGLNTHRPVVATIAKLTQLPVMHVGYRQLPDTNISGSVDDCLTAYKWLLENGARAGGTVFAGDSAGGFLVFATALKAREEGVDLPAGLVGLSPLLDLDCADKLVHANAARDVFAPVEALVTIGRLGGEVDGVLDPALSPVNGVLEGLPPSLLIAAEGEVLRSDSELMAHRLSAAGVPTTLQIWDGQVHAFPALWPGLPESRAVLRRIARFVATRMRSDDGVARDKSA
ncbi:MULTISPECIES: alpha/beta hydrolase [unclassified Rhodococcus (in: high G+C Gram-positive bacteria)]|uniref:alpha/beta hydrolase n=1 Tax=unclassified Rhodococcus (in: high G+C Gram-positive bacteria) TaxID=192944 RepID=UPI00163A5040|nr:MULTISPECIES: alpha/beta hydrolase [unclassified Rhodococcus (in: high G+C Gram-positive bacteria)]MBC2641431.1 alpha/beta hydrolase [Rhodococcus sp. 3A]MBC2893824.1 alpha/beta hydrolase [Rhodococcus sp. 4CII]